MPKYTIPYEWTVSGSIEVEAKDLQAAIHVVDEKPFEELPNTYAKDSFVMRRDLVKEVNPHVSEDELDATGMLGD